MNIKAHPQAKNMDKLNILSLEDSALDFQLIKNKLEKNAYVLDIERVDNETDFLAKIRFNVYDIILADFKLPGFNAFAALSLCKKMIPEVPFLCVSGAIGEETAIELLKQGATDFVMKDKLERLPFVIERAMAEAQEKKMRRRTETHAVLTAKILSLLNSNTPLTETVEQVIKRIQSDTGIEAVGMRLKKENDFPYSCAAGFSREFMKSENSLLSIDQQGIARVDSEGRPFLECTCGLVLSGNVDMESPLYTEDGSFWTNHAEELYDLNPESDRRYRPRNACLDMGYHSLAIIPIKAEKQIIGLLQLNDRRSNCFSPDMIRFFETIGNLIGVAFLRKQAQEELEASHRLLSKLSNQVPGVIYQYRLFPDGRSCFPYSSSGITMIYEVTPEEVKEDATPVFGRLHPDDLQRVSDMIFESARNQSHFYCEFRVKLPKAGVKWRYCDAVPEKLDDGSTLWHGIIYDITILKESEAELNKKMDELIRFHKLTVDRELYMIELKKEINYLLQKEGLPAKYKIVD